MQLWTLHPKYLDAHGAVALWRKVQAGAGRHCKLGNCIFEKIAALFGVNLANQLHPWLVTQAF